MGINFDESSIEDFMGRINEDVFIPYIQREYEWKEKQILKLFDSVLSGFPIGTFLMWDVHGDSVPVVYGFPKDLVYKGRIAPESVKSMGDTRSHTTREFPTRKIRLVLDGQQRLTSLYIGLYGSLITRGSGRKRRKKDSWERKYLYINLMHRPKHAPDSDAAFELDFKTVDDAKSDSEGYWYRLGELLGSDWGDLWRDINSDFEENAKVAKRTLRQAHIKLNTGSIINYYNYSRDDIDSMLEMFVRTNDGGESLKNKDILLSIITEYWRRDSDIIARDEISEYVQSFNSKYEEDIISEAFVMRNLLFCSDNDIRFSLNNFSSNTISDMRKVWLEGDEYKKCYDSAIQFLKTYNLGIADIGGMAIFHVLVYFFYTRDLHYFESSNKNHNEVKKNILLFICIVKLKGIYVQATSQKIMNIRASLNESDSLFNIQLINDNLKSTGVSLDIDSDFITDMLSSTSYDDSDVKAALTLMYIFNLEYIESEQDVHIDHVYPRSILEECFSEDDISDVDSAFDTVCNLQYLTDTENENKSDIAFEDWLLNRTEEYKIKNMIPDLDSYSTDMYEEFIESRRRLILNSLT